MTRNPPQFRLPAALQSIASVASNILNGSLTADESIATYRDRSIQWNPKLNAFVSFCDAPFQKARGQAPLSGVTIGVKDLFDLKGYPTRAGSQATSDEIKNESAEVVSLLEAAGATMLGKTHTVEFAFGGWGTNGTFGTPWNPWDVETHRVPGGSSSGSAVAVAAGLVTAALGTDTGGSIRTPASYCGIVGVKPSPGLISKSGVFALCPLHDTVGILARSVDDASILLDVMAGHPATVGPKGPQQPSTFRNVLGNGLPGLRIGALGTDELLSASEDVRGLFEQAVATFIRAGALLETVTFPQRLVGYLESAGNIMAAESYRTLARYVDPEPCLVSEVIRARILRGRTYDNLQYTEMLEARTSAKKEFEQSVSGIDAFIMPTCIEAAIPVRSVDEGRIVTPYGRFVNYLDLAAISVPMGLSRDGLPLGLQIVVRQNDDALMIRIANAFEELCV